MTEATPLASEQITQEDRELYLALGIFHTCEDRMILAGWADNSPEMLLIARHRIAALSASPAPVGWKLVPIEPTSEMTEAGEDANYYSGDDIIRNRADPVYRAMLAASPAPSGQGVSGEVCEPTEVMLAAGRRAWWNAVASPNPETAMRAAWDAMVAAAPAPSCAPGEVERLRAEFARLHEAARGCEFDLTPTDGPIAQLTLFVHENGDAILAALSPQGLDAKEGKMSPEERRLEDLKQMAAYAGPIVSFDVREPYYLASCDRCGWVGSSELCGTDSFGDDSDVYCPRCHASGADCGKVAEKIATPSQRLDAATVEREGEWRPIEVEAMRKGFRRSPKYYPAIGEVCRMSGPNCDDNQGYTWTDVEVLWRDDLFIVTRTQGCWPTVTKLELALFEPALATEPHQHGGKGA